MAIAGVAFIYGTVDVATKSIQFDLKKIGESVCDAESNRERLLGLST
jgi:hypothetical protein